MPERDADLRELVNKWRASAERWKRMEMNQGQQPFADGQEDALSDCADALTALLDARREAVPQAWQLIEAATPGRWLVYYREGGMAVRWLRTSGRWEDAIGNSAGLPMCFMPLPSPPVLGESPAPLPAPDWNAHIDETRTRMDGGESPAPREET